MDGCVLDILSRQTNLVDLGRDRPSPLNLPLDRWVGNLYICFMVVTFTILVSNYVILRSRTSYLSGMKRQYTPMAFQQWIWRGQMHEMLAMPLEVVCSRETLLERESSSKVTCYE